MPQTGGGLNSVLKTEIDLKGAFLDGLGPTLISQVCQQMPGKGKWPALGSLVAGREPGPRNSQLPGSLLLFFAVLHLFPAREFCLCGHVRFHCMEGKIWIQM